MGKGDKRTRKGKITLGSFGNSRPKVNKGYKPTEVKVEKKEEVKEEAKEA